MGVWGAIMLVWAAMFAASPQGAIFNELPPAVGNLSPTASTCHFLPRCDSFSSRAGRLAVCRKNASLIGGQPMSLAGLKLWHNDTPKQIKKGSVASDLFLKIDVEDLEYPATACHIKNGPGGRRRRKVLRWGGVKVVTCAGQRPAWRSHMGEAFNGTWAFQQFTFPLEVLL